MNRYLLSVLAVLSGGFLVLAGALAYWQIISAPQLLARADNPRPYEEKLREPRGRLLDSKGRVLVESLPLPHHQFQRRYAYPPLAHVTGFDNSRYGNSGLEAHFDSYLRGIAGRSQWALWWDKTLRRYPQVNDVKLTIDLDLQTVADRSLGSRKGAVVLIGADSGRLLALSSHPYFDPNDLEKEWPNLTSDPDRPFLSRATQGLYAPGSCFSVVTLASALQAKVVTLDETFTNIPDQLRTMNTIIRPLQAPEPFPIGLLDAFRSSHPIVFSDLGLRLGKLQLLQSLRRFGLGQTVPLEIEIAADQLPGESLLEPEDVASLAIGQGRLSVSPLQMALVVTTIIRDGTVPVPYLVDSVQSAAGDLVSKTQPAVLSQALSPEAASVTRDVMARAMTQGLESDKCPLISKTGTTQLGPGVEPHTWLLGFFPPEKPRYAIVVLIENGGPDARQVHAIACAVVHAATSQ